MAKFQDLGISETLCELLRRQGIREATPVQEQGIPAMRSGRDLVAQAQTGTGKTLAFLLPILEKLKRVPVTQALVVSPTRELAIQTERVAAALAPALGLSSLAIYGGRDIERQKAQLHRHPQLIIGTPGRLLDHMRRHTIDISQANRVVLDEADEMLKRGFLEDVELLLGAAARDRQIALFSATIPDRVRALSRRYMREPQEIAIRPEEVTLEAIRQAVVPTQEDTKLDKLCEIINTEQPYLAMVFCHTRQRAAELALALARRGYLADELHGELTQVQRALVLRRFRKAELQILVATDIAARGLDIEGITHVINYDIPMNMESYIHRIGRTGRAGAQGTAITFVNARQYELLRRIEAGIRARIERRRSERSRKKALENAKRKEQARQAQKEQRAAAKDAPSAGRKGRPPKPSRPLGPAAKAAKAQGRRSRPKAARAAKPSGGRARKRRR